MNDVLVLLFSAGAAAFLSALVAGVKSLKSSKTQSDEAIIRRLNESAANSYKEARLQRRRADRAETKIEKMRVELEAEQALSARRYRVIIEAGLADPRED